MRPLWRVLPEARPDRSARRTLTWTQAVLLGAGAFAMTEALIADWRLVVTILYWIGFATFAALIAWRLFASAATLAHVAGPHPRAAFEDMPAYTLLCPLYREARVLPQLIGALAKLDYPKDALQILIILEEDDWETRAAYDMLDLAPPFELILVTREGPRTKPKALNSALEHARGKFCAVFDAEDLPNPKQLRAAVAAFRTQDDTLACVQAPLLVHNGHASWIAAQFAAEYAIHFQILLPFLAHLNLPLPLGGTSNHFRTSTLRAVGGWDSFNVTEDADLGYRLSRHGYRIHTIAPPTYEEAPVTLPAWLKQRTRWIKGYLQTWLVLMRNPFRTYAEMGPANFASMHLMLGGGLIAAFAHGPLALALLASVLSPIDLLGPRDFALAISGYATAAYAGLVSAAATRDLRLARAALTMPLYWPLASIAALLAAIDLTTRPHYWAKTTHGVPTPLRTKRRTAR